MALTCHPFVERRLFSYPVDRGPVAIAVPCERLGFSVVDQGIEMPEVVGYRRSEREAEALRHHAAEIDHYFWYESDEWEEVLSRFEILPVFVPL